MSRASGLTLPHGQNTDLDIKYEHGFKIEQIRSRAGLNNSKTDSDCLSVLL